MNRLFEAIANNDVFAGRLAQAGIDWRKAYQYLGLFCFLVIIYAIRLSTYVKFSETATGDLGLGDLMKPLVGTCLISALPFAVLAYRDENWRSSDAAPVIVGAWLTVDTALSLQYARLCPMETALPLFPFVLSALVAHALGTLCRRLNSARRRYRLTYVRPGASLTF